MARALFWGGGRIPYGGPNEFIFWPLLLHHITSFDRPKRCKIGGRIKLFFIPQTYIILLPWSPLSAQKDVMALSSIFPKTTSHRSPTPIELYSLAAPFLHHFTSLHRTIFAISYPRSKSYPNTYIFLPPLEALFLHSFSPPYSNTDNLEPTTSVPSASSLYSPDQQCLYNSWRSSYMNHIS